MRSSKSQISSLYFDCVSTGKLMFRDREKLQLLSQFRQEVSPEAPWAGFYTFGEIGPVGEHICYYNYTGVVLG
jgi:small ligand-binding sensory domain FIST